MGWTAYWNGRTTIYVNDRHREVHYRTVADDIVGLLPSPNARVLDYGCGEALCAARVADHCQHLTLCDAAPSVREGLKQRFGQHGRITIASPAEIEVLPPGSFDLVVANSVAQYLKPHQLNQLISQWYNQLAPNGQLVFGDIIASDAGPLADITALLRFAHANGFLPAACQGLVNTYFSDYRSKRAELGLLKFKESDFLDLLRNRGFDPRRRARNIGHNQSRMTIAAVAVTRQEEISSPAEPPHEATAEAALAG